MRRLYAALVAIGFVYVMTSFLGVIPMYGKVDLKSRVSERFITKSVSKESTEVIYGKSSGLEDGSANIVTSIVVNYRSFDTLGEVTVLFTAALGVGLYLGGRRRKEYGREPNFILKVSSGILLPLIMMFGVYIFVHGHLTPGGGFPGGTIVASAVLLLYLSNEEFRSEKKITGSLEGSMGSVYVIIGLLGLALGGFFLFNFLPTGTVGHLFSAGVVPIVYSVIGLKVGAELSGVIADMHGEEG